MFLKKKLYMRAEIIRAVRSFFLKEKYLEVETPIMIPAPAPEVNIEAVCADTDKFLHTSPELCMKRMISSGFNRIFQLCKCFRQDEKGNLHLPEFTMLEWYCSKTDYNYMMKNTEDLIRFIVKKIGKSDSISFHGKKIDLSKNWDKMTVACAFDKYASMSAKKAAENDCFDEVLCFEVEPNLGFKQPVFLYDYPAILGSLARLKQKDRSVAERFELYIAGIELCNGFSELTCAKEQKQRFEKEIKLRLNSGKKIYPMPDKFLESVETLPDTSGNALGIDRLVMILTDALSIDDVVSFTMSQL